MNNLDTVAENDAIGEADRRIASALSGDLTVLDLSDLGLTAVPDSIGQLTALTTLLLEGNQLTAVPDSIGQLTALTTLRLDGNQLTGVPDSIGQLTALTELYLYGNQLTAVPDSIGQLTALTTLRLDGNQLTGVPDSIGQLTALTTLLLEGNQLTVVPDSIGQLTALTTLYLQGNQLTVVPDSIGQLTALTTLYLDGNQLTVVPDSIGQLTALTSLYLQGNQLTVVPDSIGQLTALTSLRLDGNQLTVVPDSIGQLTALTSLRLDGNQLTVVPDSIGQLTALTYLDLQGNQLTVVPDSIGQLTALTTLYLQGNQLTVVPDSIGQLTALTSLRLDGNQLTVVPDSIGQLTALTFLRLDGNQLTVVPDSIGQLTALTYLFLDGNPLPLELLAAAENGPAEVRRFLDLLRVEGRVITEAKLVFVGEGEVGKSTLLAALRGDPWLHPRDSTHGLEIKPVEVEHEGLKITLNAWDFGGQAVYRPTHQIFFTSPAVYVVVWKPRSGLQSGLVEQWLNMIRDRAGPGVKVHVVATFGGPADRHAFIDEVALRQRFGDMIVDFHHVDSEQASNTGGAGDGGIPELLAALAATAAQLPHVTRRYPATWIELQKNLSQLGESHLTFERYASLAGDRGLSRSSARSLARNAHALGQWVHYADDEALADLVVLKPDWLSVAISLVLEDPDTIATGGLLPHRQLLQIWNNPLRDQAHRYEIALQQVFLKLMQRFELIYQIEDPTLDEPFSLVAQLVPFAPPQNLPEVWDSYRPEDQQVTQACRIVQTGTNRSTLPPGLMDRLIVLFHRDSLCRNDIHARTHWQNGMVLQDRYGSRALLTIENGSIVLQARGPWPQNLLNRMSDIRDYIDRFWNGLETYVMLPCPEPCGLGTPGRGLFDLDKLLTRRARGWDVLPCSEPQCDEDVNINALLIGASTQSQPMSASMTRADLKAVVTQVLRTEMPRQLGSVMTRVDELDHAQQARFGRAEQQLTALMRSLDDEAVSGPRLFTLTSIDPSFRRPGWTKSRMRLTLWCEHSRKPVHVLDPTAPEAGVYIVEISRDWWIKAAPLIKATSVLLKTFLPIAVDGLQLEISEATWKGIEDQIALGQDLADAASDAGSTARATDEIALLDEPGTFGMPFLAEGAVLRQLHSTLQEQDPLFADLRKVRDENQRLLWVHRTFVRIYQPDPQIPMP